MSVDFRTLNGEFRAKVETTLGTENAPVSSDYVRTRGNAGQFSSAFDLLTTDYVQSSVSVGAPAVGRARGGFRIPAFLTGCASPGVASPDWGTLMQGCAMSQSLIGASPGTSQAITSNSITLAAGASAVDDILKGMPVDGTSGSINGQRRWITAYNGTTKVATVTPAWSSPTGTPNYNVPANTVYVPITLSQKGLTLYSYQHDNVAANTSRLRKLIGSVGNFGIGISPGRFAELNFNFSGQIAGAPTDASKPAAGTFVGTGPEAYLSAATYLGDVPIKFNAFSFDLGNTVAQFDDPSALFGYDTSIVTVRRPTGRVVPNLNHIATMDAFSDLMAATTKKAVFAWGTATGKKISLLFPALQYTGNEPGSVNGFEVEGLPFCATGLDAEIYICVS